MTITRQMAEKAANAWSAMNGSVFGEFGTVEEVIPRTRDDGETLYFVCRMTGGTVVVSSDTRIDPIIAASHSKGAWDDEACPIVKIADYDLAGRLGMIRSQENALKSSGAGSQDGEYSEKWNILLKEEKANGNTGRLAASYNPARVVAICDGWRRGAIGETTGRDLSFWNQGAPFHNLCPNKDPAGCGAIMLAMIQSYFRYPESCGSFTETCKVDNMDVDLDSSEGPYDWDAIEADQDLKARVAYNCGVALRMMYSDDASGSFAEDAVVAMVERFGFKSGKFVGTKLYGPMSENMDKRVMRELIYPFLKCERPVGLGIGDTTSSGMGHYVGAVGYGIDSLGGDLTYVCVGWGGVGDAWYALPFITTKSAPSQGSHDYNVLNEIVFFTPPWLEKYPLPIEAKVVVPDGVTATTPYTWKVYERRNGELKYTFTTDVPELTRIVDADILSRFPLITVEFTGQGGIAYSSSMVVGIDDTFRKDDMFVESQIYDHIPGNLTFRAAANGGAGALAGSTVPVLKIYDNVNERWVAIPVLKGTQGDRGPTGPAGDPTAKVSVGTVALLPAGTPPTVTNVGTNTNVILNFGIPAGPSGYDGQAATVSIGSVTQGPTASVDNVGTNTHAILNFVIPGGPTGPEGQAHLEMASATGPTGGIGPTGYSLPSYVMQPNSVNYWETSELMENLIFPERKDGIARDFVVSVKMASGRVNTAYQLGIPSGISIVSYIDSPLYVPIATAGRHYIWGFTEIEPDTFMVTRKEARS